MNEQLFCGIAYNVHDSSVSFAINNRVVLILEAERVFRKKKKGCNKEEMEHLIRVGLTSLNKNVEYISYWAMTTLNNPWLTRDDIVDARTRRPKTPYWKEIEMLGSKKSVLIINHHLSHAATYLLSPFQHAIITTCDGGGDYNPDTNIGECFAVYRGDGEVIERQDVYLEHVVTGKTYGMCSSFIYGAEQCQGKLMALAAFGEVRKEYLDTFERISPTAELIDYRLGDALIEQAFPGLKGLASAHMPNKDAKDFCASLQRFFVEHRTNETAHIIKQLSREGDHLVMAGGTGLNLELNTSVLNRFPNRQHFIAPCCDDTGQSLGALCLLVSHVLGVRPSANLPYLGLGNPMQTYNRTVLDSIVDILLQDGIALLHNGQAEIGPRALGNRSLVIRPDSLQAKKTLSEGIKQRESYRPVAPIVLEEKVHEYFVGPATSPFMLYKYEVIESVQEKIAGGVHCDGSARVQTVNRKTNPFLYDLVKRFGERTGAYVLLNTSLNLKGDPIANAIEDTLEIYKKIDGSKVLVHNGQIHSSSSDTSAPTVSRDR